LPVDGAVGLLESWVCAWADRMCRSLSSGEGDTPCSTARSPKPDGPPMSARSSGSVTESPGGKRLDGARALRLSLQAIMTDGGGGGGGLVRRRPRQVGKQYQAWERPEPTPPPDSLGVVAALLKLERALQPVLQSLTGFPCEHFSPRSSLAESSALEVDSSASPMIRRHTMVHRPQPEFERQVSAPSGSKQVLAVSPRSAATPPPHVPSVRQGPRGLGPWAASQQASRPSPVPKLSLNSVHRGTPAAAVSPDVQSGSWQPCKSSTTSAPALFVGAVPLASGRSCGTSSSEATTSPPHPAQHASPQLRQPGSAGGGAAAAAPKGPSRTASDGLLCSGRSSAWSSARPLLVDAASVQARAQRVAALIDQVQRSIDRQQQLLSASEPPWFQPLQEDGQSRVPPGRLPPSLAEMDSSDDSSDDDLSPKSLGGTTSVDPQTPAGMPPPLSVR